MMGLWVVGCELWVVGCGLWVLDLPILDNVRNEFKKFLTQYLVFTLNRSYKLNHIWIQLRYFIYMTNSFQTTGMRKNQKANKLVFVCTSSISFNDIAYN